MDNKKFSTLEKYFFLLIIGLNLIPVLSSKFFPTLDGAAHLYNSNLIFHLISGNESLTDFIVLNSEPVPNWTGHLLLGIFNSFLPAFMAEKMLLLFYLIALPLSFRDLITTISPNQKLISYLIFPFTYSFTFYLGFYNFSIALVFMLIALNFWIKHQNDLSSFKTIFKLFILITLTYFSHIFVFAILVFLMGVYVAFQGTEQFIQKKENLKNVVSTLLKKTGILILSSSLTLVLFIYYFISRPISENKIYLTWKELIDWIMNVRPIIALSVEKEERFTQFFAMLIGLMIVLAIILKIKEISFTAEKSMKSKIALVLKKLISLVNFWLIATFLLLFLYFILPDSDGTAGFVSVRLGLMFFIFLCIWLATHPFSKGFLIVVVACVLYINFSLNNYYTKATKELNTIAKECNNASKHIQANSIVLPLNYSDNWLFAHFSNYLGIDKPMIILENYECSMDYFPTKWNSESTPRILLDDKESGYYPCLSWLSNSNNESKKIDYIFIIGNIDSKTDSCTLLIKEDITDSFKLVYKTKNCSLFKTN